MFQFLLTKFHKCVMMKLAERLNIYFKEKSCLKNNTLEIAA